MLYEFLAISIFVLIGIVTWTSIWIILIEHVSETVVENKSTLSSKIKFKRNYGSHNYYWNPAA